MRDESKDLELQQSIIPELCYQTTANVKAEGPERRSVSFICRLSAWTLNFSKGVRHYLSIVQDAKTCDGNKAIAFIACAYLICTEAPFTPSAQKSDVLNFECHVNFCLELSSHYCFTSALCHRIALYDKFVPARVREA
jgi:hypothetical protein